MVEDRREQRFSGERAERRSPAEGTEDLKLAHAVSEAFRLGAVRGPLSPAAAGWGGNNSVSRLVTAIGVWAIKRHGWRPPSSARASAAFAIEMAAHVGDVPMARPVPTADGQCWAEIDGQLYRCHEWVDGEAKDNKTTSVLNAEQMGAIVARLHGLRIPCPPAEPNTAEQAIGAQRWNDLAAAGRIRAAPWADRLTTMVGAIAALAAEPGPLRKGEKSWSAAMAT